MNTQTIKIIALMVGVIFGGSMALVFAQPPKQLPPADIGQVRMHFVAGHLTLYAPAGKVTIRPGMDKVTTVIEIDTTPEIPALK